MSIEAALAHAKQALGHLRRATDDGQWGLAARSYARRELEAALEALRHPEPRARCHHCGGTGLDEDARCAVCDGAGVMEARAA